MQDTASTIYLRDTIIFYKMHERYSITYSK